MYVAPSNNCPPGPCSRWLTLPEAPHGYCSTEVWTRFTPHTCTLPDCHSCPWSIMVSDMAVVLVHWWTRRLGDRDAPCHQSASRPLVRRFPPSLYNLLPFASFWGSSLTGASQPNALSKSPFAAKLTVNLTWTRMSGPGLMQRFHCYTLQFARGQGLRGARKARCTNLQARIW